MKLYKYKCNLKPLAIIFSVNVFTYSGEAVTTLYFYLSLAAMYPLAVSKLNFG